MTRQLNLFGDTLDRPPFFERREDRFETTPVNIGRWRYYVVCQVAGFGTWGKFPGHWWAVTLWKAEIDNDKVPRIRTRMWNRETRAEAAEIAFQVACALTARRRAILGV